MANKRFLVVDDSRLARMMLKEILLRHSPGCTVVEASTGASAMEAALAERFDCAFIDLNMPNFNGLELAEHLMRMYLGLPLVLVTANVQDQVRLRAQAMGMQYLEKPVDAAKIDHILAHEL